MSDVLDLDGSYPWQTQSPHVVYDKGLLGLCEDRVVQPDGDVRRLGL
jgi:hypothetical protein